MRRRAGMCQRRRRGQPRLERPLDTTIDGQLGGLRRCHHHICLGRAPSLRRRARPAVGDGRRRRIVDLGRPAGGDLDVGSAGIPRVGGGRVEMGRRRLDLERTRLGRRGDCSRRRRRGGCCRCGTQSLRHHGRLWRLLPLRRGQRRGRRRASLGEDWIAGAGMAGTVHGQRVTVLLSPRVGKEIFRSNEPGETGRLAVMARRSDRVSMPEQQEQGEKRRDGFKTCSRRKKPKKTEEKVRLALGQRKQSSSSRDSRGGSWENQALGP